jgi:hypothetical protein
MYIYTAHTYMYMCNIYMCRYIHYIYVHAQRYPTQTLVGLRARFECGLRCRDAVGPFRRFGPGGGRLFGNGVGGRGQVATVELLQWKIHEGYKHIYAIYVYVHVFIYLFYFLFLQLVYILICVCTSIYTYINIYNLCIYIYMYLLIYLYNYYMIYIYIHTVYIYIIYMCNGIFRFKEYRHTTQTTWILCNFTCATWAMAQIDRLWRSMIRFRQMLGLIMGPPKWYQILWGKWWWTSGFGCVWRVHLGFVFFLVSEEGLAAGETQTLFAFANRFDDPCCIISDMYIYIW